MSKISLKHTSGKVVSLNSPTTEPGANDVAFKLPNADGSAGQFIKTDGSGNLSFGAGGNTGSLQVLEKFYLLADGRSVSTSNGTVTTANITAQQDLTDSFAEATGSSLTYQPPTGTTEIIYEYKFILTEDNSNDRYLAPYYVDIDGSEILESRSSRMGSAEYSDAVHVKYGFRVNTGGSNNATTCLLYTSPSPRDY